MKRKGLMILGLLGVLAFSGSSPAYAQANKHEQVCVSAQVEHIKYAEEVETDLEENEPSKVEEVIEKITNFKDTYLIPFLTSAIVVSVAIPALSFLMNYLLKRKLAKQIEENDKKAQEVDGKIVQITEILGKTEKVFNAVCDNQNEVKELNNEIKLLKNEIKGNTLSVEKSKKVLIALSELECKLTAVSKDAVANGIVKEIGEIKSYISTLK